MSQGQNLKLAEPEHPKQEFQVKKIAFFSNSIFAIAITPYFKMHYFGRNPDSERISLTGNKIFSTQIKPSTVNRSAFLLTLFFLVFSAGISYSQADYKITSNELTMLVGSWKGSLTYLDYSSGKPYTMPADLVISKIEAKDQYSFSHLYPNEPKANSTDTFRISDEGGSINGEKIILRETLEDGTVEIITETTGKDGNDNKDAIIRHRYRIGKTTFQTVKEVRFLDQQDWIKRNEYYYLKQG